MKIKEKNTTTREFWKQFPRGTEQFAFTMEKRILQAMYDIKKGEQLPLDELFSAIGIATGHFLQISCQYYGYTVEDEVKAMLYDALKKSYDYYKKNPTWSDKELHRGVTDSGRR